MGWFRISRSFQYRYSVRVRSADGHEDTVDATNDLAEAQRIYDRLIAAGLTPQCVRPEAL